MSRKQEYVEKAEARMERWNAAIEELAERAETVEGGVRMGLVQQIETLKLKKSEVRTKLDRLKKAADEIWAGAKVGVERAGSELDSALEKAREQIG